MSKILVIYHSGKGNTEKLAQLVAEGAEAGDGLAIGSPDYFSYVAG